MFVLELNDLNERIVESIVKNVANKGTASNFCPRMTVKVDMTHKFCLSGVRYLSEVGQNKLIDDKGYQYDFYVLSMDDLCDLADYLEDLK